MQAKSLPLTSPWTGPIVVALCAALGPWLVTDAPWTWGVCAVLFVAVGLPHGAVDHITYHHALGQSAKTAPWRFVGPYLLGLGAFYPFWVREYKIENTQLFQLALLSS